MKNRLKWAPKIKKMVLGLIVVILLFVVVKEFGKWVSHKIQRQSEESPRALQM